MDQGYIIFWGVSRKKDNKNGADTRIRTKDLLITNQLLYQLSYVGTKGIIYDFYLKCNLFFKNYAFLLFVHGNSMLLDISTRFKRLVCPAVI